MSKNKKREAGIGVTMLGVTASLPALMEAAGTAAVIIGIAVVLGLGIYLWKTI